MNKESMLSQIDVIEYNITRLKTLVETDLMHGEVPLYCVIKAKLQLENIERELQEQININTLNP